MRRIVLPSAFRRAIPAYSNEVIFMLRGSDLGGRVEDCGNLDGPALVPYALAGAVHACEET